MDPATEEYFNFSPYAYVLNNPTYFIDPDGKRPYPPFAGLIFANSDGRLDDVVTQVQGMQGRQSVAAVSLVGVAVGGYCATPYVVSSAKALGSSFTQAYTNLALSISLTPEMMNYLAINYPRQFRLVYAIIESSTPGLVHKVSLPSDALLVEVGKLVLQFEGDTRQNNSTSNNNETNNSNANNQNENSETNSRARSNGNNRSTSNRTNASSENNSGTNNENNSTQSPRRNVNWIDMEKLENRRNRND